MYTSRATGQPALTPIAKAKRPAPLWGLLAFVLTSLSGAFVFGWAKPVPVNPRYFRNPDELPDNGQPRRHQTHDS